jgi:hypothetical protein
MGKEDVVQRDVMALVAACSKIANMNPRTPNSTSSVSPLTKSVRTFSRVLEGMEPSEIVAMAKSFYSKKYLDAMGSDTWLLDNTVELVYGDEVDAISLKITQYARVAKDLDKTDMYETLNYHALRLIQRMATKTVAECLDEKVAFLEKKLKIKPTAASTGGPAAAGAAAGGSAVNGLNSIMSSLMSAVTPMLQQLSSSEETPLKSLLSNPHTASLMRNMSANLPKELQSGLEPMINDMQKGQFDFGKLLSQLPHPPAGAASDADGPAEMLASVFGESENVNVDGDHADDTAACPDGVCYPDDGPAHRLSEENA